METVLLSAALTAQVTEWLNSYGPILLYLIVWGLVFAGTGFFIGAFIPFITGDSLIFAAGLLAATNSSVNIWLLTIST
jgi:membrane-associated protein